MNKFALVSLGLVGGFAVALVALPEAKGANDASAYGQLDLFSDAFERVRANYVRPVKDSELIDAAIQGMVSNLDPHSSYMDAKSYGDMQITTKGQFGGVGIEVTQEGGYIKVISPIDETPAARAGIRPGDFITHLNGTSVQGLTLQEAVEQMRGQRNTQIKITIRRQGTERPIELTLTRDVIRPQVVRFRLEDGNLGYVRITSFNEQTEAGLRRALQQLKQQAQGGLKGLVLDLRNNPGGLLDQAVQVSDDFLNQGEIVSTRSRRPEEAQRWNAKVGDIADGLPIVVLINSGSASASEIVAGALQDHRRAVVVGVKSFGKGSVQTVMPIPGNGAIRLTTARYYTPSGRSIQGTGIEPDIEVLATREETRTGQQQRDREADLRRSLRNDGQAETRAPIPPPPLNLPAGLVERVVRQPAEGAPAFDPTKPETDHQLQQALMLLRGMASAPRGGQR